MRRHLEVHPAAQRDVIQIATIIAADNPDVADPFISAAEDLFVRLAETPGMGTVRDFDLVEYEGMRMMPITAFPKYLVFYTADETRLTVLRVLHGARDLKTLF